MTWLNLAKNPDTLSPDGEMEDAILRTPTDAGYEQTRPKYTRMRRSWGPSWAEMSDADVVTLKAYEQSTLVNGSGAFTWTHPDTSTYNVRLTAPIKYSKSADKFGVSAVSFVIREI